MAIVDLLHGSIIGGVLRQGKVPDGAHGGRNAADHGAVTLRGGEHFQNVQRIFQLLLIAGIGQMAAQAVVTAGLGDVHVLAAILREV